VSPPRHRADAHRPSDGRLPETAYGSPTETSSDESSASDARAAAKFALTMANERMVRADHPQAVGQPLLVRSPRRAGPPTR
jgi:hypothetical protein